jgi:protein TonB
MNSLFPSYPDRVRFQRQGWVYSMILHAIMGTGAIALVSGLRMPIEPDQFTWNVELVSPSNTQTQLDPVLEAKPETKSAPPKPQVVKPRPVPPQPVIETVPQDVARPAQTVAVNQTASTFVAEPPQPIETAAPITPAPRVETVVEEEPPVTTTVAAVQETATPVVTEPVVEQKAAEPVVQQPAAEQAIAQVTPTVKADYGWLVKALLGRIDELKNYPHMARINHWEGKVILRAVIRSDGQVLMVDVQESSGRSILDNDAIETLRKASPLKLEQPLGKPQVAILMPISYALR